VRDVIRLTRINAWRRADHDFPSHDEAERMVPMHIRKFLLATSFLLGVAAISTTSAVAAPFGGVVPSSSLQAQASALITQVQAPRRARGAGRAGARAGAPRGGRRGGGPRGGRRGGGISPAGAAAIGIFGAIGTAIAIDAARRQAEQDDAVAYCMQRYRSYNPETGLYRGYDGRMYPCP
jgi:BA14K-like protein